MELPAVGKLVVACKAVSITLSVLTIALAAESIFYTDFFMAIASLCLIISIASLTGELIKGVRDHKLFSWTDIAYHLAIFVLLLSSAIHYIVKINEFTRGYRELEGIGLRVQVKNGEAITAASFGIVQSILCLTLAFFIWRHWMKRNVKVG